MTDIQAAWAARANELAEWVWGLHLNRVDVWGRYSNLGTYTAPCVTQRGAELLNKAEVERHFLARCRGDILGLHTTSPNNTSRWLAVDIDQHGPSGNDAEANLAAAIAWHDRAKGLGFRALLTTSNGVGGYHLRTVFRKPIATPRAYSFARWLVRDYTRYGLLSMPETFPKQPRVAASGPGSCGNWLRLPGRHHKRDHWSCVWDGANWLEGAAVVEWLLSVEGDSPHLIPREAEPKPSVPLRRCSIPQHDGGGLEARITAYLRKVPNSGEGTGRDDRGFHLACFLVRDLALDDSAARPWLEQWDAGNTPPKGEAQISKWLASARAYGRRPIGSGLTTTGGRRL